MGLYRPFLTFPGCLLARLVMQVPRMARNAVVAPSAAPRAPSSATRRAAPTTADPRAATPQQPVSERTVGRLPNAAAFQPAMAEIGL